MSPQIEAIAKCLARQQTARLDRKRGFHEQDDFGDAIAWLEYLEEAKRLNEQGAKVVNGVLLI